jgi:hypothetical protein
MSVYYFLYLSNKHKLIRNYLEGIIDVYDDIITETKIQDNSSNVVLFNKEEKLNAFENIKQQCKTHLNQANLHCETLKQQSFEVCEHRYITDLIDITPDKSTHIEYCTVCGHTK